MMASPPAARRAPLRAGRLGALGLIGVAVGGVTLASFEVGQASGGDTAQTMAFATLALSELALVFGMRSASTAAWRLAINRWLVAACAAASLFVAASMYLPAFQTAFETVTLDAPQALVVLALAATPFAVVEAVKALGRRGLGRAKRSSRGAKEAGEPAHPTLRARTPAE